MHDPDPGSPAPSDSERKRLVWLARSGLFEALGAEALDGLAADLRSVVLESDEVLFRQGDESEALYVVRRGRLRVAVEREGEADLVVGEVEPGEPVGEMQAVTGGRRTATVRAVVPTELVEVPREAIRRLEASVPELVERLAGTIRRRLRSNQLTQLLPRLLGPVGQDLVEEVRAEGEWVYLGRGERLFRQGDPGDHLYLVVSGRLAAVAEDGVSEPRVLGEIPAGEPIGEMALFTGEARSASVYALRNSELVKFSKATFEHVVERHPRVMAEITRLLIGRLRRTIRPRAQQRREQTVALLPASPEVFLDDFAVRLRDGLHDAGPTLLLGSERVDSLLGVPRIAQLGRADAAYLRLTAWLDEQEALHRFVLYQADAEPTPWTRQCLQRADHVLIVAEADAAPAPGPAEALLDAQDTAVAPRRTLVLLHPNGDRPPRDTCRWLDPRRVHQHHHVRLDRDGDIHRVARFLSDRAVGLVLSGGGARGFAHIGLFRALREHGVPLDMVGGTSMGAILGAQAAMERDWETILRTSRATFVAPKPFRKYTLPLVSLLRHGVFDGSAKDTFADADLEDLWLPCFCVATNLSTAESVVYRRGPVTEATLASSALPGIVTPRIRDGHLLVDGGVLANTPTDVMQRFCNAIVVSDVTEGRAVEVDFNAFPSPWQLLWRRLSPFHDEASAPGLMSILMRTAVLGSIARDQATRDTADLYLRMPVERFGMLEMDRIDEIVEVGYAHSRKVLGEGRAEPWYERVMAMRAS